MQMSVIVPARNASTTLGACLKGIRAALTEDAEVILVDDYSSDSTSDIAKQYADHVESLLAHKGLANARNIGKKIARGKHIIFVDSDVIVPKDVFIKIEYCFKRHPDVYAVTGLLSKEHPNRDFFSQYKNLYMHFIFKNQQDPIQFLYGSIHAFREKPAVDYDVSMRYAEDTAMGMELSHAGKKIMLMKDLEVVHLKRHNLLSLIRNDFNISFYWARLFLRYQRSGQLLRHGPGFAHAPTNQILSIITAPIILFFGILYFFEPQYLALLISATAAWVYWNWRFFLFLYLEKRGLFALMAAIWTYIDHMIMSTAVLFGGLFGILGGNLKRS